MARGNEIMDTESQDLAKVFLAYDSYFTEQYNASVAPEHKTDSILAWLKQLLLDFLNMFVDRINSSPWMEGREKLNANSLTTVATQLVWDLISNPSIDFEHNFRGVAYLSNKHSSDKVLKQDFAKLKGEWKFDPVLHQYNFISNG